MSEDTREDTKPSIPALKIAQPVNCTTSEDAFARIVHAKIGSMVNPTKEYLVELHTQLISFADEVQQELYRLYKRQASHEEAQQEEQLNP